MATLVLGTVGRALGGPIGGIIGATVGSVVDRGLFGDRSGDAGRPDSLAVQSAAYGEAIPIISGRMRAAGNLIWTSGIREQAGAGGKRNGAATSDYRYTASIAVGLAARPIVDIGRIWADGRLIRRADGVFLAPTIMRLYTGSEQQGVDPLIAAAEAADGTPAYRGLAYVVFEDLALGDFGNRIPNLTFEIIADPDGNIDIGQAIANLARVDGTPGAGTSGVFAPIAGHFAGTAGGLADTIAGLLGAAGGSVRGVGDFGFVGSEPGSIAIPEADCQTKLPDDDRIRDRIDRGGGEGRTAAVEISYLDDGIDFQPGLQRARRSGGGVVGRLALACAMSADQAKSLAHATLVRLQASQVRTTVRLPWRYLGLRPGDQVTIGDDPTRWRIKAATFERFVVALELERVAAGPTVPMAGARARALSVEAVPAGPTTLHLLDLPLLPGEAPTTARMLVALAGASPGWRGAGVSISLDDGVTYAAAGQIDRGTIIGATATRLLPGPEFGWDRHATVDVALLSDAMWLESRPEASVLAGANLALVGDEIVHFASAEAVAPGVFRLSNLLRGRRGTERHIAGHGVGERFVLLDPAALVSVALPIETIGRALRVRSTGADDGAMPAAEIGFRAANLLPLAPVHLNLVRNDDGGAAVAWTRRSRGGFAWLDHVDAPLSETIEAYQVDFLVDEALIARGVVAAPRVDVPAAAIAAARHAGGMAIIVRQLSGDVGPGSPATLALAFNESGELQ